MTPYQSLWTPDDIVKPTLPLIPGVESRFPMRKWDEKPASAPAPPPAPPATVPDNLIFRPWTPDEDAVLIAMYDANEELQVIAERLGRTYFAVGKRGEILRAAGRMIKRKQSQVGFKIGPEILPRVLMEMTDPRLRDVIDVRAEPATPWPPTPVGGRIMITPLLGAVAEVCGCAIDDLTGRSRKVVIAEARQLYYWMAFHCAGENFCAIGRRCGRDHSTVMHGVAKIDAMKEKQPKRFAAIQDKVTRILARLESVA